MTHGSHVPTATASGYSVCMSTNASSCAIEMRALDRRDLRGEPDALVDERAPSPPR